MERTFSFTHSDGWECRAAITEGSKIAFYYEAQDLDDRTYWKQIECDGEAFTDLFKQMYGNAVMYLAGFKTFKTMSKALDSVVVKEKEAQRTIEELNSKIDDLEDTVRSMGDEITDNRSEISSLERRLDDRIEEIAELERTVFAKEDEISDLKAACEGLEDENADLNRQLREKDNG